jgi:hypothetical protein
MSDADVSKADSSPSPFRGGVTTLGTSPLMRRAAPRPIASGASRSHYVLGSSPRLGSSPLTITGSPRSFVPPNNSYSDFLTGLNLGVLRAPETDDDDGQGDLGRDIHGMHALTRLCHYSLFALFDSFVYTCHLTLFRIPLRQGIH